jgi:hypothetical protein
MILKINGTLNFRRSGEMGCNCGKRKPILVRMKIELLQKFKEKARITDKTSCECTYISSNSPIDGKQNKK